MSDKSLVDYIAPQTTNRGTKLTPTELNIQSHDLRRGLVVNSGTSSTRCVPVLSHALFLLTLLQRFPKLVAPGRAAYTLARQTCRLIDSMVSTFPPTKIIPFGRGFLGLCTGVVIIAKFEVLFFRHSHLPCTAMRARAGTVPTSKTILKHALHLPSCIRSNFWIPVCLLRCSMGEP